MKVVLDFDDFRESDNCLDQLFQMRARWKNFKVNLFTIPMKCSRSFLDEVSRLDWVRLDIHGWEHTHLECLKWTQDQAEAYFRTALGWLNSDNQPVFAPVFKGPGWGINANTVEAVRKTGMILATNPDPASNRENVTFPQDLRQYLFAGNTITAEHGAGDWVREHGHLVVPDCHNDLRFTWHHLQEKLDADAEFFFIEDVVNSLYARS